MSWEAHVRLAFDELRLAGAGSPQVARRLRAALEHLRTVASLERRPPLDRQLHLLDEAVRRAYADDADVDAALGPDMQGIGCGPDVMSLPPRSALPPARTSAARWLTRRAPRTASFIPDHAGLRRARGCPAPQLGLSTRPISRRWPTSSARLRPPPAASIEGGCRGLEGVGLWWESSRGTFPTFTARSSR